MDIGAVATTFIFVFNEASVFIKFGFVDVNGATWSSVTGLLIGGSMDLRLIEK